MSTGKLPPKIAETQKYKEHNSRGRPQVRWEDCVRRDMTRSGENRRWREAAMDRTLGNNVPYQPINQSTIQ